MKNRIPESVAIIALVMAGICLFQILELKNQMWNSHNELSHQISYMNTSISNIHFAVENSLREQAEILKKSDWTFEASDIEAQMVTIRCAVTPKEYRPNETAATLTCNDKEYPMLLDKGEYAAMISIPLFGDSVVSKVQLIDSGVVRTEELDWWIAPQFEVLPQINASFDGSSSGKVKDGMFNLQRTGEIGINIYRNANNVLIQSISMLEYLDGKEIEKTNIPLNTTPTQHQSGAIREEPARRVYGDSELPVEYYFSLEKSVKIPFGSKYEIYIEVVDNYGFHHRVLVDGAIIGSAGNIVDKFTNWYGAEASVYDANGNALWTPGFKW